ncbi:DNA cytosine methyltransferase [Rhizobium sp. TRM95796]|uniref:DNA cytosine methyltransferase n=1 Tax=Rhizobium sp. TRM95796 TaxID=2979862 RepID=UPI0021E8F522|nr:DNA cytosine methyltransferase [Rhizobium sp. TRM95796]MCV3769087.1 DNA cytosine methyltransferase [Rhizobium sp. TRM95796]
MRAVDFFCGAGGMSLGLTTAGIEVVGAIDNSPEALAVYTANLEHPTHLMDINDVRSVAALVRDINADAFFAGPPCQDFSNAGKGIEGDNAAMTVTFAMIAAIAKPKWIVIENVAPMLRSKSWADAKKILKDAGYGLSISTVNASNFGVPQARKRVFVIGRIGEADGFMEAAVEAAASPQQTTLREVLAEEAPDHIYSHARYPNRRSVFSPDEPMPTIRAASRRPVPQRHFDEVADLLAAGHVYMRPFRDGRGVRTLDEPTAAIIRTSREGPGPKYLRTLHPRDSAHPSQARTLTRAQTALVQGFPLSWDWSAGGDARKIDQMIANAVPSPLACAIATLVMQRARGEQSPIDVALPDWLRKAKKLGKRAVQNIISSLREAWQLLKGRILADHRHELYTLETTVEFAALDPRSRARIRNALKVHQEWRSTRAGKEAAPVHTIPDRGGLRALFRAVGQRMEAHRRRPANVRKTATRVKTGKRQVDTRATIAAPMRVTEPTPHPLWSSQVIEIGKTSLTFTMVARSRMKGPP